MRKFRPIGNMFEILTAHRYGGSVVRKFEANLKSSQRAFAQKATAFFKYAAYDEQMVCSTHLLRVIADM
tara:strand:+ start:1191 stop:1397 length:207 start_codon:yes stop_codon:yes gene_type:complete